MKHVKIFLASAIFFVGLFLFAPALHAQEADTSQADTSTSQTETTDATTHGVNIYLFWGEGCPHCAKAKPFLENLAQTSDSINYYDYEVYYNEGNQQLLKKVVKELDVDTSGVPLIIIGDQAFVGYSDSSSADIEARVNQCLTNGCPDSVASIVGVDAPEGTIISDSQNSSGEYIVDIPLVGEVNVAEFSLPALTIVIAALDGFNPCAMWVLIFLISVLLGMKSRKRMWALGSAFIIASAAVYFLFLTAWLNVFLFIGYVTWIKIIIGLIALGAGGYYLYDYYTNRNGTCKVTGNEKNKKIFEKIRKITHEQSFWIALVGIILLALAVNVVEGVCSAGLPAVYTNVLAMSNLPTWQYYSYLLLYILIFMADDLFVFLAAMITLKMVGVHQKYANYAHLLGGVVMLILGLLLIFAPQLLMFG